VRTALVTLLIANCLLLLPAWIRFGGVRPHWLALEAVVVIAVFLLLPRRRWVWLPAAVIAGASMVVSLLLLADTTARMSLNRPLNLYLDVRLVGAVRNLVDGAIGSGAGLAVLLFIPLALIGISATFARLLVRLGTTRRGVRPRIPALALLVVAIAAIPLRWLHPTGVVLALPSALLVTEQSTMLVRMLEERQRFTEEMRLVRAETVPGPLDRLRGRDVVLAFVESYGTSSVEDARYAPVVRPALDRLAEVAAERDLHVATGALEAPSQGGMSWLGHGTALSGLWLDNQLRYDLLLAEDQPTLIDDFEDAGYASIALMPQITMAWPEGRAFGYDRIWTRPDIDYRGPPLNWVEVPDQFTWAWLQREALSDPDDAPVFAEVGFISSHAPWTPVLELEPWEAIGNGEIFERWRDAGESPQSLWRDTERVQEAYAHSLHYALSSMVSWVDRFLDEGVVLVVLGDHQPAPLITGDGAPRTVPVHVVSTDPGDLDAFLAAGFTRGVYAAPDEGPAPRMSALRGWILDAFSATASTHRAEATQ
jgi:hypothetical protein